MLAPLHIVWSNQRRAAMYANAFNSALRTARDRLYLNRKGRVEAENLRSLIRRTSRVKACEGLGYSNTLGCLDPSQCSAALLRHDAVGEVKLAPPRSATQPLHVRLTATESTGQSSSDLPTVQFLEQDMMLLTEVDGGGTRCVSCSWAWSGRR